MIIDTDGGIDDASAIWWALESPEVEVVGITTVHGNIDAVSAAANVVSHPRGGGARRDPGGRGGRPPVRRGTGDAVGRLHPRHRRHRRHRPTRRRPRPGRRHRRRVVDPVGGAGVRAAHPRDAGPAHQHRPPGHRRSGLGRCPRSAGDHGRLGEHAGQRQARGGGQHRPRPGRGGSGRPRRLVAATADGRPRRHPRRHLHRRGVRPRRPPPHPARPATWPSRWRSTVASAARSASRGSAPSTTCSR